MTYSTEVSIQVAASPATVYRALLDPEAVVRWRVPDNMSGEVHEWEPREGGRFRVSLTYVGDEPGKSGAHTDTYAGTFAELVPDQRVVEITEFETDDPALLGAMTMTTTIAPAAVGSEVTVRHDGVPDAMSPADNETGTRMALAKLAALLTPPS
jgi:uncharacterized protein YndB with AHSA1/START domain